MNTWICRFFLPRWLYQYRVIHPKLPYLGLRGSGKIFCRFRQFSNFLKISCDFMLFISYDICRPKLLLSLKSTILTNMFRKLYILFRTVCFLTCGSRSLCRGVARGRENYLNKKAIKCKKIDLLRKC